MWNCSVIYILLALTLCHTRAHTDASVNIKRLEDLIEELFDILELVSEPYSKIGRGTAKLAIKMMQLENRVQQTEDLLQSVARPYLSLPNDSIGEQYYMNSFNFMDQMAASTCTALSSISFTVFQVRRDCVKTGIPSSQSCSAICGRISSSTCFDALHIQRHDGAIRELNPNYGPYSNDDKVNFKTYHYGSRGCTWKPNHCGPNYCCCRTN